MQPLDELDLVDAVREGSLVGGRPALFRQRAVPQDVGLHLLPERRHAPLRRSIR